jgi:hypothetical protein
MAIASALSSKITSKNRSSSNDLTVVALFCAGGLSVTLLLAAYGMDIVGYF